MSARFLSKIERKIEIFTNMLPNIGKERFVTEKGKSRRRGMHQVDPLLKIPISIRYCGGACGKAGEGVL